EQIGINLSIANNVDRQNPEVLPRADIQSEEAIDPSAQDPSIEKKADRSLQKDHRKEERAMAIPDRPVHHDRSKRPPIGRSGRMQHRSEAGLKVMNGLPDRTNTG